MAKWQHKPPETCFGKGAEAVAAMMGVSALHHAMWTGLTRCGN
jgi:hypothetical protein